jgi:hypothetical protein
MPPLCGTNVQFLCVCVDSTNAQRVAILFHNLLDVRQVVNAYIPSSFYMPRGFGQLGCSGFVVVDTAGNFVSRKTTAYLDYGEGAFRHLEQVLQDLVAEEERTVPGSLVSTSRLDHDKPDGHQGVQGDDPYIPPTTGIASMDHEHETCTKALQALVDHPNQKNLQVAYDELQGHFAHEEALMVEHGLGGAAGSGDPFSPLTSHMKDHQRILRMFEHVLRPDLTPVCLSDDDDAASGHPAAVAPSATPSERATAILQAFYQHATTFDALYGEYIPSTAT